MNLNFQGGGPSFSEMNGMRLARVGRNFVDFEVRKHVTLPAHLYSAQEGLYCPEEGIRPSWRVREMSRDEHCNKHGIPSTSDCRIYR